MVRGVLQIVHRRVVMFFSGCYAYTIRSVPQFASVVYMVYKIKIKNVVFFLDTCLIMLYFKIKERAIKPANQGDQP